MKAIVHPDPLHGSIAAIASKSAAHRLLICAALSDAPCTVFCNTTSSDIEATADCLRALGACIEYRNGAFAVTPLTRSVQALLPCRESGSTLRFLLPVTAALGADARFCMQGRLPSRPLSPLREEIERHGCHFGEIADGILPLTGRITSGEYTIDASVSSQFVSGLLFALPLLSGESRIHLTGRIESKPYITMTLDALKRFAIVIEETDDGYRIPGGQTYHAEGEIRAEGDWSNAAFPLCAAAISGGTVTVTGLDPLSLQGDRAVTDLLQRFGAHVECSSDAVTVRGGRLHGIEINAADIPDLVPVLAAVAASADGVTHITSAGRLRLKESDRLQSVTAALRALGAEIAEHPDGLTVCGKPKLAGGTCDAANDHRIAMMAAVAAQCCAGSVTILGAEAVRKSYPGFFDDYRALGGNAVFVED